MKNLKFKTKLFMLIGIAIVGLLIFGVMSYTTLNKVKIGGPISNELRQQLELSADIAPPPLNIIEIRVVIYQMLRETDKEALQQEIAHFQELKKAYQDAHEKYVKSLPEGKEKELVTVKAHDPVMQYFQCIEQDLIPALLRGDKKKAEDMVPTLRDKYAAHNAAMLEGNNLTNETISQISKRADDSANSGVMVLMGVGLVVGVIVSFLGLMIARSILGPLGKTLVVLQGLSDGDLRHQVAVDSTDEIGVMGQALNKAIESMSNTIQSIAGTAEHVASASEELSSSATQQAQGAETQTSQTTQVATAMQEMSSTVLQVSENSNKAAEASRRAAETARQGGEVVEQTLSKMRTIAESVGSTAKQIEELGKSSDQIGRIIAVIDDIADQTNLLALNAAIEAARAGEQGRGFAVVADEVRKLAERTTTATKEIAQMIRTVQDETKTAVTAMEEGTKQVEEGVQTTAQAGDSLKQIIQVSEEVGEMITHIATAATEQSSATEEINNNMDQISKLVKESADGAQQSAKACQDLSGLALDLQKMVSNFKLEDGNGRRGRKNNGPKTWEQGEDQPRAKAFAAGAH